MRVVSYCRISQDRTGAGLGVERQAQECAELAQRLGLPAPEVISDNDLSAYSGKPRPGYERLLAGLGDGRWTHLLTWHVDRLTRSVRDLEDVVDAVNGRVVVHTVRGGEIDLSSAEGRLNARLLGTVARYESEHKSDRISSKARELAQAGKPHGGPRRFGFEKDGTTVRESEAVIVRELVSRVIDGDSCRSLAMELTKRGLKTPSGGTWTATAVKRVVTGPRIAGLRVHRKKIVGKAAWHALVDVEDWKTAVALLNVPERMVNRRSTRLSHQLVGVATCSVCTEVVRIGSNNGKAIYRCAKGCVQKSAAKTDAEVDRYVVAFLEWQGITPRRVRPEEVDPAVLKALETRIGELEDALVGNPVESLEGVSSAGLKRNLERLNLQLGELEAKQALARAPEPHEGITPPEWTELPVERRRAVIARILRVTLIPSGRNPWFDPDTIRVERAVREVRPIS